MPRAPRINQFKRATARRLRKHATDAEARLWSHLRRLETRGSHFRRQMPIGQFVVDFARPAAHLVIEVDGSQHAEAQDKIRDEQRTRWLESEGYRIWCFWNNDIALNLRGVLEAIYAELYGSLEAEPHALKHTRRRGVGLK